MSTTVTPAQVAVRTGMSIAGVYRRAQQGHLVRRSGGGRLEFDATHVAEHIDRLSAAERRSMTVPAAARHLGVSRSTLYHMIYRGHLDRSPSVYREIRITRESLNRVLSTRDRAAAQ